MSRIQVPQRDEKRLLECCTSGDQTASEKRASRNLRNLWQSGLRGRAAMNGFSRRWTAGEAVFQAGEAQVAGMGLAVRQRGLLRRRSGAMPRRVAHRPLGAAVSGDYSR